MKRILLLFFYLNICCQISWSIQAQQLSLEIRNEGDISETLKDSLIQTSKFQDFKSIRTNVDSISERLIRFGYIESRLKNLKKQTDSLYVAEFYFGKKYSDIKVYYNSEEIKIKDLNQLSSEVTTQYFKVPITSIESVLKKLNQLTSSNGNAFGKLQLTDLLVESETSLQAKLAFTKGERRTVDDIEIKGYEKFPKSFLKYYAGVKLNKAFDKQKIVEQNSRIDNLGFVKSIKAPEILFEKDSTTVYFYFEKQNYNLFDGILGFATDETTNKLIFNGYLNLELNNNLNFGEQLLLNYKSDGNDQQNFRVRTRLPYILRSPIGVGLELKIFKRDSTFSTTDQQARVIYQVNPKSEIYIGYKSYESSNLLDNEITAENIDDFNANFFLAGTNFSLLQNSPLFPVKTQIGLSSEIGKREQGDKTIDQLRLEANAFHIFNIGDSSSIYFGNQTGFLSSDDYLTNELFRFGGIKSIRGFNENSIDASLFSVLNIEYRYLFGNNLYLHSITDVGYFENQIFNQKEQLYSFGLGFGLQSAAGIFNFNIANGNTEGQDFKFSNTKIHISLTSRF